MGLCPERIASGKLESYGWSGGLYYAMQISLYENKYKHAYNYPFI